MNRFNLTFKGEIIEGHDPEQVQTRLAEVLEIDDPALLERYFSGESVVLRHDLERKEAAALYARLRRIGIHTELDRIRGGAQAVPDGADLADAAEPDRAGDPAASASSTSTAAPASPEGPSSPASSPLRRPPPPPPTSAEVMALAIATARPAAKVPVSPQPAPPDTAAAGAPIPETAKQERAEPVITGSSTQAQATVREDIAPEAQSPSALQISEAEFVRRADLAAKKALQAEEADLLKAKEEALAQALQAKEQEKADLDSADDPAVRKALQTAEAALLKAKEEALAKALQAKEREKARLGTAGDPAVQKTAANDAELANASTGAKVTPDKPEPVPAECPAPPRKKAGDARAKAKTRKKRPPGDRSNRPDGREAGRQPGSQRTAPAGREHREAGSRATAPAGQGKRKTARRKSAPAGDTGGKAEERERATARKAGQAGKGQQRAQKRQRSPAEEARLRQQEQQKSEKIAARLREENTRRKAEEARLREREQAQQRAEEEQKSARRRAEAEQNAQRRAMEEQAIQRAAAELAQKPSLKPVEATVRTRLETPSRKRSYGETTGDRRRRKRQPGEPNLYSLSPFRNTPTVRARAGQSKRIMRLTFTAAAISFAAATILGAALLMLPAPLPTGGAGAIAVGPGEKLLLLAGDHLLLHDRAGVSASTLTLESLGLASLGAPMAFNGTGELMAPGRLAGEPGAAGQAEPPELMRCTLSESRCVVFSAELAGTEISALAVHPEDGTVFIADGSAGELLKVSPTGRVMARASASFAAQPVLRLDSGLLLTNSATGAALTVFRYEDESFGQRLDEIPLLPPATAGIELEGIRDFLFSGGHWWALLERADTRGARLYRFDPQWQFVDSPGAFSGSDPGLLVKWGSRVLVDDPARIPLQRFSSLGVTETPLISTALTELVDGQTRRANLIVLAWRICIALCLLIAAASFCMGWLHRARSLVYTSCREQGAEPLDGVVDSIEWVEVAGDRGATLRRRGAAYAAVAAAGILIAAGLSVSALALSALLLAMTGPAIALLLLYRSDPGHIGIGEDKLLLVDHGGMYHLGGGSRVHYRGPFLMIDDVTVFTGSRLLPAYDRGWIENRVTPFVAGGVKVDCTIVTVKLLQSRHPLALGATAIAATSAGAVALLSLQGIF